MRKTIVIGKNFGDEGKGLVTASLSLSCEKPLIIKSNGGAQAGHTVENAESGKRFVHHQTGSGSEYGASTLWAETYHPDLYTLRKEIHLFEETFSFAPIIYSEPDAMITIIDDVIINMAIESKRGDERHGSCGMGINECCLRVGAGFTLSVGEVFGLTEAELFERLSQIRNDYSLKRSQELGLVSGDPYMELLEDENVLSNFASEVLENLKYITLTHADSEFLKSFDGLIFENGQGLLLDEDNERFAPHVSASKTGVNNPMKFLKKRNLSPDEVIYVTRPYVTRHGAGDLPCECSRSDLSGVDVDATNIKNEWQGIIRYGKHESFEEFVGPAMADIKEAGLSLKPSFAITHMDETGGKLYFHDCTVDVEDFKTKLSKQAARVYLSYDHENIN